MKQLWGLAAVIGLLVGGSLLGQLNQSGGAGTSVAATQSGTWTVQPGNTANTTPWLATARIVGNTGATIDSAVGAATAPTNQVVTGQIFNSTPPAPTTGQALAVQADSAGSTYVNTEVRK